MTTISAQMIKDLRELTGAPMGDCKKALVESNGAQDKAIEYLQKKSMATAQKKSTRTAVEGRVGTYVHHDGKLAVIDAQSCRACGICAANCPEVAIAHNLSDDALFGRVAVMTEGVEKPVVGFYCKECAGAAIGLSGQRRDRYPENVRLIELPCLGRVSALHIVEAARLGAAGVFLAGCAEGRCQYRSGDTSAREQMQIAGEVLAASGTPLPLELWHLCAVDRLSVGRRIRLFAAKADGELLSLETLEREMELIGAAAGAACGGGEACGRGR